MLPCSWSWESPHQHNLGTCCAACTLERHVPVRPPTAWEDKHSYLYLLLLSTLQFIGSGTWLLNLLPLTCPLLVTVKHLMRNLTQWLGLDRQVTTSRYHHTTEGRQVLIVACNSNSQGHVHVLAPAKHDGIRTHVCKYECTCACTHTHKMGSRASNQANRQTCTHWTFRVCISTTSICLHISYILRYKHFQQYKAIRYHPYLCYCRFG